MTPFSNMNVSSPTSHARNNRARPIADVVTSFLRRTPAFRTLEQKSRIAELISAVPPATAFVPVFVRVPATAFVPGMAMAASVALACNQILGQRTDGAQPGVIRSRKQILKRRHDMLRELRLSDARQPAVRTKALH